MPKTTCDRCKGSGETFTLSGLCACDSCCGRGFFGEDDAEVARLKAEKTKAARAVRDQARAVVAHFTDKETAAKVVRVLVRQRLLVDKL